MTVETQEILDFINNYIEENHGEPIVIDSYLSDAKMDSFSDVMLFVELDSKWDGSFDADKMKEEKFDYNFVLISEIVDRIKKWAEDK